MSTRLLRANSSARLGVSKSSRLSLPSIWRTISASSRRLLKRSSMMRTVLRWARASASSEMTPGRAGLRGDHGVLLAEKRQRLIEQEACPGGGPDGRGPGMPAGRCPEPPRATREVARAATRAEPRGTGPARRCRAGISKLWSGREDLNLRPPAPHAGALPGCATPRHEPRIIARSSVEAQQLADSQQFLPHFVACRRPARRGPSRRRSRPVHWAATARGVPERPAQGQRRPPIPADAARR